MTSNTDTPGTMYRWIERKPLTEAVSWTSREKFWLITAACHFGTHDWKSIAQVVKNAGEQYRPKDWYTSKNCERQFKVLVSNLSKEVKSLPLVDMLQHIAEGLRNDYLRDANKSKDSLKTKYCNLFSILNRVKQGNLSRNEVVSLYSQARRNEIEGKQYMEQLMTRQNASLASENSSSGLSEETIKWNTPSAPLLTSLLRSRNTIPANRTVTTIASLLQSPGSTSRTRSGKMLPLSSSVKTTSAQGTPTLSKLLEAPANPYLSSPPQSTQKNKPSEVAGTDKLIGNISRKENSLSTSLNKVQVDNVNTSGSLNQINKSDVSVSKKQTPKSPVSTVKSGSKSNSNIVNLLSDSDNDEESCNSPVQNTHPKEKKDTNIVSRIEPRATRSQTRAEGSFKQLNDSKISDGKKEQETLKQENGGSQITETNSIEDDLIDIDQIEVEPLLSVHDELTTQTPSKVTRSSVQRSLLNTTTENLLTNKVKSKEINNQMLEEISANFVLNSSMKNVATEYKNVMVGRSRIESANISGCIVPIGGSASKEAIIVRKDGQSFPTPVNMLTTFDGKILKQKRIIDLKGTNIKCIDGKISFTNPVVLLKKPFNIKLTSELKNKTDDIQLKNNDPKKTIRINNSSQNLVQILDANQSLSNDVNLGDGVIINMDDKATTKTKKLAIKESQNLSLTAASSNETSDISVDSKSTSLQSNEKKTKNDKTMFNVFGKSQNLLNTSLKKSGNQDGVSKVEDNTNINEPNNRLLNDLGLDFEQSISQSSMSELYNEEIVEMHSFDNEELNTLIACHSLENNEIEETQNAISIDHGDSSVSESDSTIGAFDTFAQITGVPPKSSSKDMKTQVNEQKILSQGENDLEHNENLVQCDEIDDEQSSSAVSVTGIPVLQNVISDVMSKIDSDRNLFLNKLIDTKKQTNVTPEIIELFSSSDDEDSCSSNNQSNLTKQELPIVNEKESVENPAITLETRTKIFKQGVFCGFKTDTEEEDNKEIEPPADVKFVKSGLTKRSDAVMKHRVDGMMKTIPDEKINSHSQNRIELDFYTQRTKSVAFNTISNAILNFKMNEKNNAKEVKNNETEIKFHVIDETTINSKEIASGNSNEKLQDDSIEVLINDDVGKNKKEEEMVKDIEIVDIEQLKKFEAEVMQRAKRIQGRLGAEMLKIKEAEARKSKEMEIVKAKEIEMKKTKDLEIKKAKEIEMQKTNDIEMPDVKEIETRESVAQKAQEVELQKTKEAQIKHIKDDEVPQVKEVELIKETEIKNGEEAETLLKNKEKEIFASAEAAEKLRARQSAAIKLAQQSQELQKQKETLKNVAHEAEPKRKQEEIEGDIGDETKKSEGTEIKKTEEVDIKKTKEVESKEIKNIEIKETEDKITIMKGAELKKIKEVESKEAQLKKAKETEMKMRILEVQVQLQREELDDQSKKANRLDQSTSEVKKVNVEETEIKEDDMETIKSKESALKLNKSVEIEVKKVKEVENKMSTRTRGSKTEEKLKDSNLVSKNIFVKSAPAVKPLGSSSSMSSSSHQTKNVYDENKRNDDINKTDKNVSFGDHTKTEISGKSRTRSSSLKKNSSIDTMSISLNKSNEKSEDVIVPKASIGVKTRIVTSSQYDVPSSSANLQRNAEISRRESLSKALSENNLGKQLTVPLVKISTNRKPYYAENFIQRSDIGSVKQPVVSITNNESILQKTIEADEKIEKPAPKKRGRKRRIDVQTANSSNQQNLQNGAVLNTSISTSKEVEPLAKRTRRSIETRESKKETIVKSPDDMNTTKKCLKHFYKSISERNKCHLSSIEKEVVKDLPPESDIIVKSPVFLQDIRKRVNSGEMAKISDLQINLMMMSFNAIMINRSDNAVFNDASNFQADIYGEYLAHRNDQNTFIEKDGNSVDNINFESSKGFDGINAIECITIDDDNDDGSIKNDNEVKTYNRITRSNKESSSDSESDRALPPKKRKRKYFCHNSNNDVDSDYYDSEFI